MEIRGIVSLGRSDKPGQGVRIYVNGLMPKSSLAWAVRDGEDYKIVFRGEAQGITCSTVRAAITALDSEAGRTWAGIEALVAKTNRPKAHVATPAEPTITVLVDSQEPSEIVDGLRAAGLRAETASLGAGRYLVEGRLDIRRRNPGDAGDAVRPVSKAHRGAVEGCVVVVMETYGEKLDPAAWGKAMEQCCRMAVAGQGAPLQSRSRAGTIAMIVSCVRMAAATQVTVTAAVARTPAPALGLPAAVLMRIPGISEMLATALLRHFGNVAGVAGASCEDLAKVAGIGPRTADMITAGLRGGAAKH